MAPRPVCWPLSSGRSRSGNGNKFRDGLQNSSRIGMSKIHRRWGSDKFGGRICGLLSDFDSTYSLKIKSSVSRTEKMRYPSRHGRLADSTAGPFSPAAEFAFSLFPGIAPKPKESGRPCTGQKDGAIPRFLHPDDIERRSNVIREHLLCQPGD